MVAEADEGLLLATVQVYTPASDIVRVWVYCAVSGSFNTVSFCSPVISTLSLVQDTVVAGPPVEIQVRVSWSESYVTPPDIVIFPTVKCKNYHPQERILLTNHTPNAHYVQ